MAAILNPLASLSQITRSPSVEDGIPYELEMELRAYGCKMIQQAGVLLKQNQVAMAAAQILFQRFWYVSSMKQFTVADISMGALYLASKLEECPLRIRDLVNIYDLLLARSNHALASTSSSSPQKEFVYVPMTYFASAFYDLKDSVVVAEMQILKRLGFNVSNTTSLPFGTLVNYLKVLELIDAHEKLPERTWGYLNDGLQTPIYATFPMPAVVCAAIFLSTRYFGIALPDKWWELFDVEWEDLWIISGWIMRLYSPSTEEKSRRTLLMRLAVSKIHVRKWLEEKGGD